jgi:hypothetical protein
MALIWLFEQVLNGEEEIQRRNMQASLRAAMLQPSENATDGSSVSRLAPRMTVDVNFGDIAVDSDVGSNQGTPGRPLHHFHSISPSTASFARSPFGSMQHHSVSCLNGSWNSLILIPYLPTFVCCMDSFMRYRNNLFCHLVVACHMLHDTGQQIRAPCTQNRTLGVAAWLSTFLRTSCKE